MKEQKLISVSKIETVFLLMFFLALLPFVILTFFSHPSEVEDFFYMDRMENIGFLKASKSLYNFWSGRFFSHTVTLLIYFFAKTDIIYKITTLLFMIAIVSSVYFLIKKFCRENISTKENLLLTFAIFFLYMYSLPTVSQGFYWLVSVTVYNNSIILILLFLICYLSLYRSDQLNSKILYTALCSLIAFCVGGSNEIALISLILLTAFLFVFNFKKLNWSLILISLFMLLGSYINFRSQGTQMRQLAYSGNHNFTFSIFNSFSYISENILVWIFTSPLIPVSIILLPLLFKSMLISEKKPYVFQLSPVYSIFISIIILYGCTFVFFWSTGIKPYPRSLNFIYFVFLVLWFYNVTVLINYFRNKFDLTFEKLPLYIYGASFILIMLFLLPENNLKTAYSELISGTAQKYDKELNERYELINISKSDTVLVEKLTSDPATTRVFLITSDPENIFNKWLAKHFKKKLIISKDEK